MRLFFFLALSAFAQDTPTITDAQRAEYWKLAAKLNASAAQVNALQLQLAQAHVEFDEAKGAYEADVKFLGEKVCGSGVDTSDEPKCKPKPEDPKTKDAVPEPHAGGKQ